MGARSVTQSLAGSRVFVDVVTDERRVTGDYWVRPPSVREALGVLASASGGEIDAEYLQRLVKGWLPADVYWAYFESGYPPHKAIRAVTDMLSVGHESRDEYDADLEEAEKKADAKGWHAILADYRHAFGADPLEETWSYFLAQYKELLRIRRVGQALWMQAYSTVKGGDKKSIREIFREAFPGADRASQIPDISDEHLQEQLEKIRSRRSGEAKA